MTRATVLSAGSWGTAFAKVLADAGTDVTLWARRPEVVAEITNERRNSEYFPHLILPGSIRATTDAAEAISGADIVVLSVPSQTLRGNLAQWAPFVRSDATLVSLMKGVELGTGKRMSEVISEAAGVEPERIASITGPNLAPEIAAEQIAATVVACVDEARATAIQAAIATRYFRPYRNDDMVGCELGGAVKNAIALAYGMASAMGFGDNTKATLITRGLAETARLGMRLGADPMTFAGLAGLGDLVATCSSPLSRNRTFGEKLGQGMSVAEVQESTKQIAEGVKSCRSVLDLARAHGVEVPITEAVVRVCHEGEAPAQMVKELMSRESKAE
jgi:glycerol-3-phosphate dehydrogenase (NAD(P)+)